MKRPRPWSTLGLSFLNIIVLFIMAGLAILVVSTIIGAVLATHYENAAQLLGGAL